MSTSVSTLRSAIDAVTRILADRDVPVHQRGLSARVEYAPDGSLQSIIVPYLPDNAPESLVKAIHGFIDHEVGHVLDTDSVEIRQANAEWAMLGATKQDVELLMSIHNIIEDVYVEARQEQRFRGCGYNFNGVREFLIDATIRPELAKSTSTEQDFNLLLFAAFRAWGGQRGFVDFMTEVDGWNRIAEFADKIPESLRERVGTCKSTADTRDLTRDIYFAMNEPKEEESETEDDQEDDQGGEKEESQKGETDEESEEKSEDKSEDQGDESEKPGDNDSDEKEESDDQESDDSEKPGDNDSDEKEESDDQESDDSEKPGDNDSDESDLNNSEPSKPITFDEALSSALEEQTADLAKCVDYLVYSEEGDVEEVYTPKGNDHRNAVAKMQDRVGHLIGRMTKTLERVIKVKSLSRWAPGHRRGRLNSHAVSRIAISASHPELATDRICKRKEEAITSDAAVAILVDCSGSMLRDDRIQTALDSAYGIALTLERLGISCEVTGFTTKMMSPSLLNEIEASQEKTGLMFARLNDLYLPIFKKFGERINAKVSERFARFEDEQHLFNYTITGEPILKCYNRLLSRPEKGKLMFVLTDGVPYGNCSDVEISYTHFRSHAKLAVEQVEADRNVDIVGVGIGYDASWLFKRYAHINQTDELPAVLMRELKGFVLGQVH